jgi:hypothetical protein
MMMITSFCTNSSLVVESCRRTLKMETRYESCPAFKIVGGSATILFLALRRRRRRRRRRRS